MTEIMDKPDSKESSPWIREDASTSEDSSGFEEAHQENFQRSRFQLPRYDWERSWDPRD